MSGAKPSASQARSWTHTTQVQKKRPVVVLVWFALLLGLVTLFGWMLWGSELPKVYAKSILIPESIQPQVSKLNWNLESIRSAHDWTTLPSREISNTAPLENALSELPSELRNNNANAQDTLLLQIRGQALIYLDSSTDGATQWRCGFRIAEDSKESNKKVYPFEALLNQIKQLPIKNIVILADVCDIKNAPGHQLLTNPVNHYLVKACESVPMTSNRLWIITSASDSQPSMFSEIEKQTLFQKAIAESLKPRSQKQPSAISLREFYESVAKYCYTASNKQQTPLLIWGGAQPHFCTPSDPLWTQAENVVVARVPHSKTDSEENTSEKENRPPSKKPTSLSDEPIPKFDQLSPLLQFWWLRDRIANDELSAVDEKTWHWSPLEFSPWKWRKLQRLQAQLDAAESMAGTSRIDSANLDELIHLARRICPTLNDLGKNITASPSVARDSMLNDFGTFAATPLKRLWEEEEARWVTVRSHLRRYAISISELLFWRDLVRSMHEISSDRTRADELKSKYFELVQELRTIRSAFPADSTRFVDQYSGINADRAWNLRAELRSLLAQIAKETTIRISKSNRLSWSDEHAVRFLLMSPVLPFESRSKMIERLQDCDKKNLETVVVDTDSLAEIFRAGPNPNAASKIWANCYEAPLQLIQGLPFAFKSSQDLECGHEYLKELDRYRSGTKWTDLQFWHAVNLTDLELAYYEASDSKQYGIVLAPVGSKQLEVTLDPNPFLFAMDSSVARSSLGIKRKDGSSAAKATVALSWYKLPLDQIATLKINGYDVDPARSNIEVDLAKNLIEIVCGLKRNYQLPEGASLHLRISENESFVERDILMYQGSERIEMRVYRDNPGDTGGIEVESSKRFTLSPPAALGSTSTYRFELINYKPNPRRARAHLKWNNKTIASSESVDLPACIQRLEPVTIRFKADASVNTDDIVQGAMLIEIEELEPKPKSATPNQPPTNSDPEIPLRQSPYVFDILVHPERPSAYKLFEIQSHSIERNRKVQFAIRGNQETWNQFGIKQLPVQIRNSDVKSEAPFEAILMPDAPLMYQGPVLDTRSIRLDLDAGGYPRDTLLLAEQNDSHLQSKTISQFVSSVLDVVLLDTDGKEVNAVRFDDQIVVPEFKPGPGDTREQVVLAKLRLKAQLDLKAPAKLILSSERFPKLVEREIRFDRSYPTRIAINSGKLSLSCNASELSYDLPFPKNLDSDAYRLAIAINDNVQIAKAIIIDKLPPQAGKISCSKNTFRSSDKEMEISLESSDEPKTAHSGVSRVEFFLRTTDSREDISREDIPITSKAMQSENKEKWTIRLTSETLDNLQIPPGQIRVLAKSFDRSGNVQTKHQPAPFQWSPSSPTDKTSSRK